MKREVDVPKMLWRAVRLGAMTMLLTLLLLWGSGLLLRYEVVAQSNAKLLAALTVFPAALIAQLTDRSKGKGIASTLLGTVIFLFLLLILGAGMPKTALKPSALTLPGAASALGGLTGLLLHFNKMDSRSKLRGKKYYK